MVTTNGRTITTKEASVKTAEVSIKALAVNGKQVTMGLFRQLKNEDLIDPDTLFLVLELDDESGHPLEALF